MFIFNGNDTKMLQKITIRQPINALKIDFSIQSPLFLLAFWQLAAFVDVEGGRAD